jgi:predicted nuclease with TOPRIM domain
MRPKTTDIYIIPWFTILFAFKSIYGILEYLYILNNKRIKLFDNIQENLNETKLKYEELQKKYDDLYIKFENLNQQINVTNIKNTELSDKKNDDIKIYRELYDGSYNNIESELHIKNIEHNFEDINNEFIESLSLDYDNDKNSSDTCNHGRSRSTSLTEVNWPTLTLAKKIIFG